MKQYIAATAFCFAVAALVAQETEAAQAAGQGTKAAATAGAATGADAAPAKTLVLTADSAVEQALNAHLDVQRGKITLEQAERKYKHAWNNVLPSITASGKGSESRQRTCG